MGKIENYTQQAINIANDNSHGYSQYNRWGNPDYDCSALVITVVQNAGIPVKSNGATYTGNMHRAFINSGFRDITSSINLNTGYGLQRGDVLLSQRYHTEIYLGNGKSVGAMHDEYGGIVGRSRGDQDGTEISVHGYYNYPWTNVLRFTSDNSSKSTSKPKKASNGYKKIKNENWYGVTQATCNVRTAPSLSAPVVAQYEPNSRINYDSVYEGDGYRWISYIGWSGKRRYVAYRQLGDNDSWIAF